MTTPKTAYSFTSVAKALEEFNPWPWRYFHPNQDSMACKGTGRIIIVPDFLTLMDELREEFGRSIRINSWYRSPEYNAEVSATGLSGPHTTGRAVDVRIYGGLAMELATIAYELGMTGFGWKQTGPYAGRFLHLDNLENSPSSPRAWTWTYS